MAARFLSRMFDPRRFVKGLSIVLAVAVAVGAAAAVASGFARMSGYVQPDRTASPAVRANPKAHVIFASPRDGDLDVYAASADGRRRAALTRNGEDDFIREVAADGRVLVDRIMGGVVAVVSADGRRERRFAGDVATFALGGGALVLGTEDYQMFLVPLAGGGRKRLGIGNPYSTSANGRFLLFEGAVSGRIGVYDLVRLRKRILTNQVVFSVGFAPGGTMLAYLKEDGEERSTLFAVDAADPNGKPRAIAAAGEIDSDDIVWSDRETLVYRSEGDLHLVGARTGASKVLIRDVGGSWASTSDAVAYARGAELVLAPFDERDPRVLYRSSGAEPWDISWSPDATLIAFASEGLRDGVPDRRLVVDREGAVVLSVGSRGSAIWAPNSAALALTDWNALRVVTLAEKRPRRVMYGHTRDVAWAKGALSDRAPRIRPLPPVELAGPRGVRSRGRIAEIASDGRRVGALAGPSLTDCRHTFGWQAGSRRVVRFQPPQPCEDENEVWSALRLSGTRLTWSGISCGHYCYRGWFRADVTRAGSQLGWYGEQSIGDLHEGSPLPKVVPRRVVRRGVAFSFEAGTIRLRRIADGRVRTIRPRGGAVDAELEAAGLFYAHNVRGADYPGRVEFIPFARLLP